MQKRKKYFIDSRLQGRLIMLMVALEIVMLTVAMLYLNNRFESIIEHDLYAIHRITQADILSAFIEQIGWVVFEMGILNAMMLFIAHFIWSRQLSAVVQIFHDNLYNVRSLKFVALEHVNKPVHELLTLLDLWYSNERKCIAELKQEIGQIKIQELYQNSDLQKLIDQVNRCLNMLQRKDTH